MSIDTYYTVLGVVENASQAEIKAAYRELVRQVHPDSVPNASPYWKREAEEKTKEINEAYSVLSDLKKRREYDRLLAEARQDQQQAQPAVNHASPPTQPSTPQPNPMASRPKQSSVGRRKTIADVLALGLFLLFIAGTIFLLLRTTWGAFVASAIFAAALCWRKLFTVFPRYKRWCVVGVVVSVGFLIADFWYPAEESKPVQVGRVSAPTPGSTPVQLRAQDYGAGVAVLRNGFTIRFERKEQIGEITRLYVSGGYVDVPSADIASFEHDRTPDLPQPQTVQQKSTIAAERPYPNAHLPNGVFSSDPMEGYGETKPFMGSGCSWNNVDAESKKRWIETGTIPNHTFLISSSDETCYIWNQDVGLFLSKGAVRGEPVFRAKRVVGYRRPPVDRPAVASSDHPGAFSAQPVSSQVPHIQIEQGSSQSAQPEAPSLTASLEQSGPKHPDLSSLTPSERQSIESACLSPKMLGGPAAYNRCLIQQLGLLSAASKHPDLSSLTPSERQSIESACLSPKMLEGPAAYNQCLNQQLGLLSAGPRQPNLSGLTPSERQSIESACLSPKMLEGPAAYNQCLVRQLQNLNAYRK